MPKDSKNKLKVCLMGNTGSIHFVKSVNNIFKTADRGIFHIIDVCPGKKRAGDLPASENLVHHLIPGHIKSSAKYFLRFLKIKSIIKKIQPDIVHCYGSGIYGLIGFLVNVHPLIVTVYGSEIYNTKKKGFFYKFLISKIIKSADLITYASDGMRNFLINYLGMPQEKLVKIYWGIDSKIFYRFSDPYHDNLRKNMGINKEDVVFFSNRRILPLYNISTIVEAFYKINKIFNNTKLILIKGDVPDFNSYYLKIKNIIHQGIREGSIILIEEFIEQKRMAKLYNISNAFISIPETDELSASVFEGMACGSLPIITDIGTYRELKDKCEILFIDNGKNIDGLAQKMIYLIKNYNSIKDSISDKNRNYVLNYIAFENIKINILKMYNSILKKYETNISKF